MALWSEKCTLINHSGFQCCIKMPKSRPACQICQHCLDMRCPLNFSAFCTCIPMCVFLRTYFLKASVDRVKCSISIFCGGNFLFRNGKPTLASRRLEMQVLFKVEGSLITRLTLGGESDNSYGNRYLVYCHSTMHCVAFFLERALFLGNITIARTRKPMKILVKKFCDYFFFKSMV